MYVCPYVCHILSKRLCQAVCRTAFLGHLKGQFSSLSCLSSMLLHSSFELLLHELVIIKLPSVTLLSVYSTNGYHANGYPANGKVRV